MPMPGRDNGPNSYRYKYQGQEKDPETGKEAFELRLWDSRIGRWLTTDPYGQYNSPYLGMGNDPINGIDPDGGLFGRIRAWAHKLFNGGSIHERSDGKWAWQKATGGVPALGEGDGDLTGLTIQYKNFGYGGLGKFKATGASWHISGEHNIGILNHGLDLGLVGLELNANTTLGSFQFGRKWDEKSDQWVWDNESFDNKMGKYSERRGNVGFNAEFTYIDVSGGFSFVKPAGTKGNKWQTSESIKIGAAIFNGRVHNISSKGIDIDFNIAEGVGGQFFYGVGLDFEWANSWRWEF